MADCSENYGDNYIYIFSISHKQLIEFPAFINDFTDQYTSNWNSQEIYGRMDPVYTYKNTIRKISLSFDVPSANAESAKTNFINISSLIRGLYPMYDDSRGSEGASVISSPPIFRIKFKNFIQNIIRDAGAGAGKAAGGLLGWIDGCAFKPDFEKGFFEEGGDIYSKSFKVSFNFNVLHEHPLGWSDASGTKPRYFVQDKVSGFPYRLSVSAPTQNNQTNQTQTPPATAAGVKNGSVP